MGGGEREREEWGREGGREGERIRPLSTPKSHGDYGELERARRGVHYEENGGFAPSTATSPHVAITKLIYRVPVFPE